MSAFFVELLGTTTGVPPLLQGRLSGKPQMVGVALTVHELAFAVDHRSSDVPPLVGRLEDATNDVMLGAKVVGGGGVGGGGGGGGG